MSKLPTLQEATDISLSEMEKINKYMENGLPGISEITDSQLYRMYELYLSGSTYTQIANTLMIKKVVVLYLAHKSDWYTSKKEHLNEIQENVKNRVLESKIRSSEFMLLLVQSWQKKIGNQLVKYLSTNDKEHMEEIDLKEVSQLMKAIEMVSELDNYGKDSKGKTPAVGLNLGNGVTVEKTGDNKITITPKEEKIGDILKQYADSKREEEKNKLIEKQKHDIIEVTKGVKDEN